MVNGTGTRSVDVLLHLMAVKDEEELHCLDTMEIMDIMEQSGCDMPLKVLLYMPFLTANNMTLIGQVLNIPGIIIM